MSPTYRYDQISHRAERTGACPVCGRRVRRARTFTNTVSPFNRNADGTVRTPTEVRKHLATVVASGWVPDFTHDACRGGAA